MKKKAIMALVASLVIATAWADDYPYLTFRTSNGEEVSVATSSLVITFENGNMVATTDGTPLTISLADLSKMFFSADATGIDEVTTKDGLENADEPVEVFTLTGISVGKYENLNQAKSTLQKGIYVVKGSSQTLKIAVK